LSKWKTSRLGKGSNKLNALAILTLLQEMESKEGKKKIYISAFTIIEAGIIFVLFNVKLTVGNLKA